MCQPTLKPSTGDAVTATDGSLITNAMVSPDKKFISSKSSKKERSIFIDILCFIIPAVIGAPFTNVFPIYLTAILRMISTHLFMTLHFIYVDKDNYANKLNEIQLRREKKDYLVGTILHMWAQLALQLMFPGMFFTDSSTIPTCAWNTLLTHVAVVEPLYYVVHIWLHKPEVMKKMHGHHHQSVNTLPSTSLVQNFQEHFIYIATFGPAMIFPYFIAGAQNWMVIAAYLILFDLINAFGHTNIRLRHWIFTSKYSPIKYLFYTPEFHLGHHNLYNCNYALFMPLWDFIFQTYREFYKTDPELIDAKQQDFVFLGHNGGLGHFLTCPEVSMYNIYDPYKTTGLPIQVEILVMSVVGAMMRLFLSSYRSVESYLLLFNLVFT